jgi:ATP-dependent Clp protease adaptor protein ClpS
VGNAPAESALFLPGREEAIRGMAEREDGNGGDADVDGGGRGGTDVVTSTRTKAQTKRPSMYRVLILNDDYTPMEFVVFVLERFFNKSREEATRIMLHVHQTGVGQCGVFTYEVAETKVAQVVDLARRNEHPLQCTMEKE